MANKAPPPLSRRLFDKYDKDRSGEIDAEEFKGLCYELGYPLTKQNAELALKIIDVSGDGKIRYDEFHKWYIFIL